MENKKYSIKQGYVVREIAGEFIAVPVDSSCGTNIIILNPVSKLLWEELREEKSFDELGAIPGRCPIQTINEKIPGAFQPRGNVLVIKLPG